MNQYTLIYGDCLQKMRNIQDASIDMIFSDLPYGSTHNDWDVPIDLATLWQQYKRILKPNGVVCLWAQTPFDKVLGASNLEMLRYEWIIEKTKATGHLNAKKMPMKAHENILIFYKHLPTYHPQMTTGHTPVHKYTKHTTDGKNYGKTKKGIRGGGSTVRYPRDVLKFKWDTQKSSLTSTQKPVAACTYFIETYTNPGDIVLDNCMGSGSIGIACLETGRQFIGIEMDEECFAIAAERLHKFEKTQKNKKQ